MSYNDYKRVETHAKITARPRRTKRRYKEYNKDRLRIGEDKEDRYDLYESQKRSSIIGFTLAAFFLLLFVGFLSYLYFGF